MESFKVVSTGHYLKTVKYIYILLMYSASTSAAPTTVSREFQETPCFPPHQKYNPWISRRLEVATMPHPRSSRRGQDGCPSSAHLHPSLPSHPPTHSTQDQWGSWPVDPSDKGEGETRRGRGSQPGRRGRRGSSTRAEEEAVQRKTS